MEVGPSICPLVRSSIRPIVKCFFQILKNASFLPFRWIKSIREWHTHRHTRAHTHRHTHPRTLTRAPVKAPQAFFLLSRIKSVSFFYLSSYLVISLHFQNHLKVRGYILYNQLAIKINCCTFIHTWGRTLCRESVWRRSKDDKVKVMRGGKVGGRIWPHCQ